MLRLVVDNSWRDKVELYFDINGVLISEAQYVTGLAEKKRILSRELEEVTKRLKALRADVDRFHLLEVSRKGRLTFEEREAARVARAKHGQMMRNEALVKELMGKWMYV